MSNQSTAEKLVHELQALTVYQVIDKFLDSEQRYVRQLRLLNEFERRLRCHFDAEDYILNIEDIDAIFITTGSLYNFTRDLVETLNKKRWDGPEQFLLEIGDLLTKNMQFFKMYGQYNQDLKAACERFNYLMERESKFKRWVDFNETVAQLKPGEFIPLLKTPQQHFPTYSVFLQSMVSALARLSSDHPATESITNSFKNFLQVLDEISIKAENTMRINRVVDIQKIFFKDGVILVDPSRKWYRTSKIKIRDAKESKKQLDAQLFLFNDCVCYGTSAFFGGYNLTGVMSIAGLEINPLTSLPNSFKLSSSITNREWEITCVTNETPDQRRLENKETAERSFYSWLGALLKVYKIFYNINLNEGGNRAHQTTALSTRVIHPEDLELILKKKAVASPRQVEKPTPCSQANAQAAFDRLASQRQQQQGGGAMSPTPAPVQAAPTQPSTGPTNPGLSVNTAHNTAPQVPTTPRRAAPVPTVKHLTDDEIRESIPEGTKLDDWEKVYDASSQAFYYENVPLQTTTWDEPDAFVAEFNRLRAENDAAVAKAANVSAAVPPTPSPAHPPTMPPVTPAHPPTMPPATPAHPPTMPPATPAHPPAQPPATPAHPPTMPPSQPPATPATPAHPPTQPPAGPPSSPPAGPPGMPGPGRGGLLSAIQGGAQLKKVDDSAPPAAGPPPAGPPKVGGGGILAGIQGGVQLKKVDAAPTPAPAAQDSSAFGLNGNLMASLANYRKFVQDDDEQNDDDDDW